MWCGGAREKERWDGCREPIRRKWDGGGGGVAAFSNAGREQDGRREKKRD